MIDALFFGLLKKVNCFLTILNCEIGVRSLKKGYSFFDGDELLLFCKQFSKHFMLRKSLKTIIHFSDYKLRHQFSQDCHIKCDS